MVNLFGKGFIGSNYAEMYPCIVNDRNNIVPAIDTADNILYMISTIDNYSVKTNPYIDIETNLTTLMRVLENYRQHPRSKDVVFNFVSSWFVYGDTDLPAKETSYCNPKGFYSITKRAAEQMLISYCETYGLKYRILRFANVVGGKDPKTSRKKNALTYLINEMKKGNKIELYDGGDFIRDYIHVKDLCRAVKKVIDHGELNSVYNIGNGIPIKFRDIINHVTKLGSTSEVVSINQAEFHKIVQVKSMYMNTDKLKLLGYVPEFTIYDTVEEIFSSQ